MRALPRWTDRKSTSRRYSPIDLVERGRPATKIARSTNEALYAHMTPETDASAISW